MESKCRDLQVLPYLTLFSLRASIFHKHVSFMTLDCFYPVFNFLYFLPRLFEIKNDLDTVKLT